MWRARRACDRAGALYRHPPLGEARRDGGAGRPRGQVDRPPSTPSSPRAPRQGSTIRPDDRILLALRHPRNEDMVHLASEPDGLPVRFVRIPLLGDTGLGAGPSSSPRSGLLRRRGRRQRHERREPARHHRSALRWRIATGASCFLIAAFRKAAGLGEEENPVYPSDLVVKDDEAVVADAVRRFAMEPVRRGRHRHAPEAPTEGAGGAHHRLARVGWATMPRSS